MKIKISELKSIIRECINEEKQVLYEAMTYDQLVHATKSNWPTRFENTKNVITVPPKLVVLKSGNVDLQFNYRSTTSKSGNSHLGQIIFFPNKMSAINKFGNWWKKIKDQFNRFIGKSVPPNVLNNDDLRKMNCKCTCDCEDFLYRMEVANHKKDASDIKYSNGKDPIIRNPQMRPGLCKHLLGTLKYLINKKPLESEID